jgi:hypothetical protein
MKDAEWKKDEKKVARRAFDIALGREYDFIIKRTREMATKASNPSDILELNRYLSRTLKEIDWKYDYRYSKIITVFAQLVSEGWVKLEELDGLDEEKIERIKRAAGIINNIVESDRSEQSDDSEGQNLHSKKQDMNKDLPDTARLEKMVEEAMVDAYTEEEQTVSFLTMLEDSFSFPFHSFALGNPVEVVKFDLDEGGRSILAVCRLRGKVYRINATSLEWKDNRPAAADWIEAYRFWLKNYRRKYRQLLLTSTSGKLPALAGGGCH